MKLSKAGRVVLWLILVTANATLCGLIYPDGKFWTSFAQGFLFAISLDVWRHWGRK